MSWPHYCIKKSILGRHLIFVLLQNFSVNYWINKGATKDKLILGVPFYGQSFSLMDNVGTSLGAPTYAGGEAGDETRARGFLSFYEVKLKLKKEVANSLIKCRSNKSNKDIK